MTWLPKNLGYVIRRNDGVAGRSPAGRKRADIDVTIAGIDVGREIMRVGRRIDIAEVESQRRLVVQSLGCAGNDVDDLGQVQPADRGLVGQSG